MEETGSQDFLERKVKRAEILDMFKKELAPTAKQQKTKLPRAAGNPFNLNLYPRKECGALQPCRNPLLAILDKA